MNQEEYARFGRLAWTFTELYDAICRKLASEDDIDDVDKVLAALLEPEHEVEILNSTNGWLGFNEEDIATALFAIQSLVTNGKTMMFTDQIRQRAELYYSELVNHTFIPGEYLQYTKVCPEYPEHIIAMSLLPDLSGIFVDEIIKLEPNDENLMKTFKHHQLFTLAKLQDEKIMVFTYKGWKKKKAIDYKGSEVSWFSGAWFEPA